jgi:hypothetical protein
VLLAPHPTPKLEDHPLSAVRDCLFNIFVATLNYLEAISSIHNMRKRHAVVPRDPPNMGGGDAIEKNSIILIRYLLYVSWTVCDVLPLWRTKHLTEIEHVSVDWSHMFQDSPMASFSEHSNGLLASTKRTKFSWPAKHIHTFQGILCTPKFINYLMQTRAVIFK